MKLGFPLEEAEVRCPKCGGKPSWGYGFAAGVLGSYSMCQGCYAVLHVTADTEGLNEEDAAAANAAAETYLGGNVETELAVSDTPITDSQVAATNRQIDLIGCASDGGLGLVDAVTADFARKLERDLLEALSSLAVYQMREAAETEHPDTERLNWLDGAFRKQIDGIADGLHKFIIRGATLREAIDAYRGRK